MKNHRIFSRRRVPGAAEDEGGDLDGGEDVEDAEVLETLHKAVEILPGEAEADIESLGTEATHELKGLLPRVVPKVYMGS